MKEEHDFADAFYHLPQVQQYHHTHRRDRNICLRDGRCAPGNGDLECFPTRPAAPLGRVSEQVLRRRRLQVFSLLIHIHPG